MYILGISAYYHDSAACLIKDGEIIAAAQEERFTRKKQDSSFPINAVNYCLKNSNIKSSDIDYIAFYDKPFIKFERILETYLAFAPKGISSFIQAMPVWIKNKLWIKENIRKELDYEGKIIFPEHHESHAASSFFPSPFDKAAFLTIDGVGEWTTTSYGVGDNNKINILAEIKFPHSIGLLYSAFTYYTGFKVNSGEYKLMGLAPYGKPKYKKLILDNIIDIKEDGSYKLNMKYFNYCAGLTMTNSNFHKLFGGSPRKSESKISQKEMDIASSIQEVVQEIILKMVQHIHSVTKQKNLCLAGGVALNCVSNNYLYKNGPFENIWIQPAAGDAGGALGAALFVWYQVLKKSRQVVENKDSQKGSYLGPKFSRQEIKEYLDKNKIVYQEILEEKVPEAIADLIANQNVVGWFQGRMEYGPRALGARSILGDARSSEMQQIMNLKIKFRESFRPFAPTVMAEHSSKYFDIDCESPYMLYVAQVKDDKLKNINNNSGLVGLDKLKIVRSEIPAVTHVDNSARLQTVNKTDNPLYHEMINQFNIKYGCPVIINTSFNVRGEPIVCAPDEAYLCFMRTNMDYLIMENILLKKEDQPNLNEDGDWRKEFELD